MITVSTKGFSKGFLHLSRVLITQMKERLSGQSWTHGPSWIQASKALIRTALLMVSSSHPHFCHPMTLLSLDLLPSLADSMSQNCCSPTSTQSKVQAIIKRLLLWFSRACISLHRRVLRGRAMIVTSVCQLGWAIGLSYLVKTPV